MKLHRIELAFDGQPQDVGLFDGVYGSGPSKTAVETLEREFKSLPIPPTSEPASYWFTDHGLKKFRTALDAVAAVLASENWSLLVATMNWSDKLIKTAVYADEFQVGLPMSAVAGIRFPLRDYRPATDPVTTDGRRNFEIRIPDGTLRTVETLDPDAPGIAILRILPDGREAGACVLEHNKLDGRTHVRIYSPSDPDGDPIHDIILA